MFHRISDIFAFQVYVMTGNAFHNGFIEIGRIAVFFFFTITVFLRTLSISNGIFHCFVDHQGT